MLDAWWHIGCIVHVLLLVGFLLFGFFTCLSVLVPELSKARRLLRAALATIEALVVFGLTAKVLSSFDR